MIDEFKIGLSKYPGYKLSSEGYVEGPDGFKIEPYLDLEGLPSVNLKSDTWQFKGPIAWLMLHYMFIGNKDDVDIFYHDGNPLNTHIDNLMICYQPDGGREWLPIKVSVLTSGMRSLDRRKAGKRVRIVETGEIFDTVKEAAEHIGGTPSNIYTFFRGGMKSYRGFTFERV